VGNNPVNLTDPSGLQYPVALAPTLLPDLELAGIMLAAAAPEAAGVTVCGVGVAGLGAGLYYGAMWAIEDPFQGYPLPMELQPGAIQPTYGLPQGSTVGSLIYYKAQDGVESMAAHLGFLYGGSLNGFPNPFNKHDRNKRNYSRENGTHIRDALRGIQRNLQHTQDLRGFLQENLSEDALRSLTEDLNVLVEDLQRQGWAYEQFGPDVSEAILRLLADMKYIRL
jgi:hypothetical protein